VGRSEATPALGLLLVVGAATSWAVGNVVARRASRRPPTRPAPGTRAGAASGLSMTVWSATVVPLPLFALAVVLHGWDAVAHALAHPTPAAVLSTLYTAWFASLLGYGIWNTLLARHPAAAVVPYAMLVPVVGFTTAWLVQGEVPNAWEAAGGAVLLLGVAVTTGVLRPPRVGRTGRPGRPVPRRDADRAVGSAHLPVGPAPDDPAPTPAR